MVAIVPGLWDILVRSWTYPPSGSSDAYLGCVGEDQFAAPAEVDERGLGVLQRACDLPDQRTRRRRGGAAGHRAPRRSSGSSGPTPAGIEHLVEPRRRPLKNGISIASHGMAPTTQSYPSISSPVTGNTLATNTTGVIRSHSVGGMNSQPDAG